MLVKEKERKIMMKTIPIVMIKHSMDLNLKPFKTFKLLLVYSTICL